MKIDATFRAGGDANGCLGGKDGLIGFVDYSMNRRCGVKLFFMNVLGSNKRFNGGRIC